MIRYKTFFLLCFIVILLSGCWDTMNIEDRGFIIGTGIDLEEMKEDKPIYNVTDQLVLPQSFGNAAEGNNSGQAFLNLTSKGTSIYKVNERVPAISSKSPYYEHLKVVIISEQVAKTDHLINQLFDRYIRDVALRRGIIVLIAKDSAKKLLDVSNPESKLPAVHIENLLKRSSAEIGFPKSLRMGEIEEFHLRGRSYILPIVSVKDGNVEQRTSGAVFHGQKKKMVGSLGSKDMQSLALYYGEGNGSTIDFTHDDRTFAFKLNRLQSKPKVDSSNPSDIKVNVDITLYGTIKETSSENEFSNKKKLKSLQEAISKEAKKTMEDTIEKAQTEYNADVFKVWRNLEIKDYHTWKKLRDDWETGKDYFANNVTFHIDVTTEIYAIGASEKT